MALGITFLFIAAVTFVGMLIADATISQQMVCMSAFIGFGVMGVLFLILSCLQDCKYYLEYLTKNNSSTNQNNIITGQQEIKQQPIKEVHCPYCNTVLKKETGGYFCTICLGHFDENLKAK